MLLLELALTDVRSPCRRNVAFFNFCIILSCNCTHFSAIMAAIWDFTGEAALPISETAFPATGNSIGINIVKITPIEDTLWQSVPFYIQVYVGGHLGFW